MRQWHGDSTFLSKLFKIINHRLKTKVSEHFTEKLVLTTKGHRLNLDWCILNLTKIAFFNLCKRTTIFNTKYR